MYNVITVINDSSAGSVMYDKLPITKCAPKFFLKKIVKTTCVKMYDKPNTYQMRAKNFLKKIVKTKCVTTHIN